MQSQKVLQAAGTVRISGHARLVVRHWGQLARQVWVCVTSPSGMMKGPKKSLLMDVAKQLSEHC